MSDKIVTVYSLPTWPGCKMTKSFLEKNNIPFQDFDVAQDKDAREEMVKKSGQRAVPQIDIDGEIFVGFDEAQLTEKLGL